MTEKQRRWLQLLSIVAVMLAIPIIRHRYLPEPEDPFMALYKEQCAVCHGEHMEGAAQGPAPVGRPLLTGESVDELRTAITRGIPDRGMPAWGDVLDEGQISSMALLIAERRQDLA